MSTTHVLYDGWMTSSLADNSTEIDTERASSVLEAYQTITKTIPGMEDRPMQQAMVLQVDHALTQRETCVIEAGTGAGKSFGYLLPALLSDARPVVISTGTIALQEQLLHKDIPTLSKAAGLNQLNVQLVKGRGNYLCIQKLSELEASVRPNNATHLSIQMLKQALETGWDGDQATLDWNLDSGIWQDVASDGEDCLGAKCPFHREQPYGHARKGLEKADILIVNHALYLQDVFMGNTLLPPHEVVIFDEAHQLKPFAMNALTARIGKYATTKLIRKIHRRLMSIPETFQHQIAQCEAELLEWLFRFGKPVFQLPPDDTFLEIAGLMTTILQELQVWVSSIDIKQLPIVTNDLDADKATTQRDKLVHQLDYLLTRWELFLPGTEVSEAFEQVHWAEVDKDRIYFELKATPLTVSNMLAEKLWSEKTAILTSATLTTDAIKSRGRFNYLQESLGLPEAVITQVYPSPFDYQRSSVLYLPDELPDPNDIEYAEYATKAIDEILAVSQGRAFVLLTSYQNLRRFSEVLIPQLPYPCKVQGDLPRNRLVEWFKTTPNSVLFATSTFWEGIDVPGEALSCVIMDKIPFLPPDDPVNAATIEHYKATGKDWFSDYMLPQAILRLKQGFGRLIRRQSDRGIVAILDPRIRRRGYGKMILRSLPQVPVLSRIESLKNHFDQLELPTRG